MSDELSKKFLLSVYKSHESTMFKFICVSSGHDG